MKVRARWSNVLIAALVGVLLLPWHVVLAQQIEPQAWDGQQLSDQSADVQRTFQTVWAAQASEQWAKQHSSELLRSVSAAHGVPVTATSVIPDAPPVPGDTTVLPLTWTTTN